MRIVGNVIILILLRAVVFAQPARQDTTTVFSRPGYDRDPIRSKWRKVVEKKDSLWEVSFTGRKNVLQEKISYEDARLEVRKGPYAKYENGVLIIDGAYHSGYKTGKWSHYDAGGKPFTVYHYKWDKLDGPYQRYWSNGQIKEEGVYTNNQISGKRILFYSNGKLAASEFFEQNGSFVGIYYNGDGKTVSKSVALAQPSFPDGI